MAMRALDEIEQFVTGTVVTVVSSDISDYPHYYLGGSYLGWAEYVDTSAFDPFELLGFTIDHIFIDVDSDYNQKGELESAISDIIDENSDSLTNTIAKILTLDGVSVES